MTAYNLYPTFTDREGYLGWCKAWKRTYTELSRDIRRAKFRAKMAQRASSGGTTMQKELNYHRAVGRKMMTLLGEAKLRRDRILAMHKEIANQGFPVDLGPCKNVDVHYNRGRNEFDFLPMWVIRAKGKSYYVQEIESDVPWTTRSRASGSTKGVLRVPRGRIVINDQGVAKIHGSSHENDLTDTAETAISSTT